MVRRLSLLALLASSASAAADPVGIAIEQERRDPAAVEPTRAPAPPVDPDPDQASGVAVEDAPTTSRARAVPRAILFIPKIVLWGALQPVRGVAYLVERDGGGSQRIDRTFEERHTLGGYPIASYESDLGGVVGARVLVKNLLGEGERLRLRVDGGTAITYGVGARVTTGTRFAPIRFVLDGDVEKHPHDHFYGIGNGPAMESEYEQELARGAAAIEADVSDGVELRLALAGVRRDLSIAGDVNNVYLESEATYDTRRAASVYPSQTLDTAGWLVRGYGRLARGTGDMPTRYVGYGGEVEHVIDLRASTRTLTLRLVVDGVTGEVPFVDLPSLGGPEVLRGYPSGRFRDRTVVASTAEYTWRLFDHASGYTFVDAGAPFAGWGPLDDGPIRVGFGGGLLVHTKHTSFARAQLAFSRDGDVNVSLAFQPTAGRRERARRGP